MMELIRQYLINWLDNEKRVKKLTNQIKDLAEVHRLTVKAARRVVSDLSHAIDELECKSGVEAYRRERLRMWKDVFFDTYEYRDSLHREIDFLNRNVESLENELKECKKQRDTLDDRLKSYEYRRKLKRGLK